MCRAVGIVIVKSEPTTVKSRSFPCISDSGRLGTRYVIKIESRDLDKRCELKRMISQVDASDLLHACVRVPGVPADRAAGRVRGALVPVAEMGLGDRHDGGRPPARHVGGSAQARAVLRRQERAGRHDEPHVAHAAAVQARTAPRRPASRAARRHAVGPGAGPVPARPAGPAHGRGECLRSDRGSPVTL